MRSISRVADVSINTVSKLLVDAGKFCAELHDRRLSSGYILPPVAPQGPSAGGGHGRPSTAHPGRWRPENRLHGWKARA